MKTRVLWGVQIVYGALFFVFGLNGFFKFMDIPSPPPPGLAFVMALGQTGFIFPIVKGIETLAGLSLIIGKFTPLMLVILTPVLVVITLYNIFLAPSGLPMVLGMVAMHFIVTYKYWSSYKHFFRP